MMNKQIASADFSEIDFAIHAIVEKNSRYVLLHCYKISAIIEL